MVRKYSFEQANVDNMPKVSRASKFQFLNKNITNSYWVLPKTRKKPNWNLFLRLQTKLKTKYKNIG